MNSTHRALKWVALTFCLSLAAAMVTAAPSGQATAFGARVMPHEPATVSYTDLSAGFDHSLAIRSDGTVLAWGNNLSRQCTFPDGLNNVVAVAAAFGPSTTIRFALGEASDVDLAVFDVRGRRVRTLVAGRTTAAGQHERVWNGRDESGRAVSTGVYFYRLNAGDYSETRRMVMLD
jgi:hypothetical protein